MNSISEVDSLGLNEPIKEEKGKSKPTVWLPALTHRNPMNKNKNTGRGTHLGEGIKDKKKKLSSLSVHEMENIPI